MIKLLSSLALIVLTAAGCSFFQPSAPEISLVDLQLGAVTVFETAFTAELRITNPDTRPLRITGAVHRLYLNGIELGKAISNENLVIPALSRAAHTAQLNLSNLRLAANLQQLFEKNELDYRIESILYTGGLFGLGAITVQSAGTLFSTDRQAGNARQWQPGRPR